MHTADNRTHTCTRNVIDRDSGLFKIFDDTDVGSTLGATSGKDKSYLRTGFDCSRILRISYDRYCQTE